MLSIVRQLEREAQNECPEAFNTTPRANGKILHKTRRPIQPETAPSEALLEDRFLIIHNPSLPTRYLHTLRCALGP